VSVPYQSYSDAVPPCTDYVCALYIKAIHFHHVYELFGVPRQWPPSHVIWNCMLWPQKGKIIKILSSGHGDSGERCGPWFSCFTPLYSMTSLARILFSFLSIHYTFFMLSCVYMIYVPGICIHGVRKCVVCHNAFTSSVYSLCSFTK
jgi:hypothetical protein